MSVEDLVTQLEAGGEVAAEGGFTLDRERAREKLRQFQLADPHRWVLLVVQGLVARGASSIAIEIDADDVHIRADGTPLDAEDFEWLYSSLFSTGVRRPGLRELALGTNAAMALNPRWILIESGDSRRGLRFDMRPGADDWISESRTPIVGTHVHVKERFRPGLLVRFLRQRDGALPEQVLLRERCRHADTEIRLGGVLVSGQRTAMLPGAVELVVGPLSGWAALDAGGNPGRLAILRHGVWIAGVELAPSLVGMQAIVEARALRTDASMSDVVRDATFEAWMAGLVALHERLLGEMYEVTGATKDPPWWLQHALRERLASRLRGATELPTAPMLAKWCTYPLWRRLDGTRVAMAELLPGVRPVGICTEAHEAAVPGDMAKVLYVSTPEERAGLEAVFAKRLVDRTAVVKQAIKRDANRAAWRNRPHPPRLPDERGYRLRLPLAGEALVGEIGVSDEGPQRSFLRVVLEGCMLAELPMETALPGVHAVVQGPVVPSSSYDAVVKDGKLAAIAFVVAAGVAELVRALARNQTDPIPVETAQLLTDAMHGLATPAADIALLRSLGFSSTAARDRLEKSGRPWGLVRPGPDSTDPLAHARVFLDGAERPLALLDIASAVADDGTVRVIGMKRPPLQDAPQLFVRAGERKLALLRALFGVDAIVLGGEEFERCVGREAFRRRVAPQPVGIHRACRRGPVTFVDGARRGVVALLAGPEPTAAVNVFVDDRPLVSRTIACGVPGVVVAVDVEPDLATPKFDDLVPDADAKLAPTVRAATIELLEPLVVPTQNVDELGPVIVAVARLVWPAPAMLRAWIALRAELGAAGGDEAYGELLAGLERHRPEELFADVQERLAATVVPMPQLVLPALAERPAHESWGPLRTAALQRADRLLQLRCLRRLDGAAVGLDALVDAIRQVEPVRFVDPGAPGGLPGFEDVVVLDEAKATAIAELLGADSLIHVGGELVLAARKRTFEHRAELTTIAVRRDQCIVAIRCEAEAVTGELAVPPVRPGTAAGAVIVCHRRRALGTIDPGDGLPWIGVLDGEFGHESGYEGVSMGDRSRIGTICKAHHPAALRALAEAWPQLRDPDLGIARAWMVRLLGSVAAGTWGAPLSLAERGVAALGMIPLFTDVVRRPRTLDELHLDWRQHGDLVYARGAAVEPPRLVVAIADDDELAALAAIFGTVRDWGLELSRQAEVAARRRSSPPMPEVPDDAIATVEFEGRGLVGRLWLVPDVSDESEVSFGRDGRVVGQSRVSSMFPCLGAVTGPGLEIDTDWTGFELGTPQQNQLKKEACNLYDELRAKASSSPSVADAIARPLRNLLLRLHAIPTAHRKWPNHDQRKLYRELRQLPLFGVASGRAISLAVALRERPAELDRLGLWDPRERELADTAASGDSIPVVVEPAPVAVEDPPAAAPAPIDPHTQLLEAVRAELRFVRTAQPELLAEIQLERLSIRALTGDAMAHWLDDALVVDARHPVVQRAVAEPGRALLVSIVASAVYTALNCALQEVTDAHELGFLRWHAAHVRTAARGRTEV